MVKSSMPVEQLPITYEQAIGKLIVTYAYIEKHALRIVYMAAKISPQMGEMIVRAPRVTDTILMIEDICDYLKIPFDRELSKKIYKRAEHVKKYRDLVSHSNWIAEGADYSVIRTRGSWNKAQRENHPHKNKAVISEAIKLDDITLLDINITAMKLLSQLVDLGQSISAHIDKKTSETKSEEE